jgi:DNA-directed RNA polymerase subunit RPC12/RpoP
MFCSHCGKEIPSDSVYCPYCGAKQTLEKSEEKKDIETPKEEDEPTSSSFNPDDYGRSDTPTSSPNQETSSSRNGPRPEDYLPGGAPEETPHENFQAPESEENPETAPSFDEEARRESTTHLLCNLTLIFGVIGTIAAIPLGIIALTRKPNNHDKALAIVGLAVYVLWLAFEIVYLVLIYKGIVPNPYA